MLDGKEVHLILNQEEQEVEFMPLLPHSTVTIPVPLLPLIPSISNSSLSR